MRIGFYAPLKPPDALVPSGDRRMARQIISCLKSRGHEVRLMSRLKTREPDGLRDDQIAIENRSNKIAANLVNRLSNPENWCPEAWFTYHLFYKAPDWIGPKVSKALNIPYIVAEASHAPKRKNGGWRHNHEQVEKALYHADLVIGLNSSDEHCVRPALNPNGRYSQIKPFLENRGESAYSDDSADLRDRIGQLHQIPRDSVWFLTVAMMREGAKLESYKLLGTVLKNLNAKNSWSLIVIGDGQCRSQVEKLFTQNTFFLGTSPEDELTKYYKAADIFLWPAVREAYGMALLEAQWAGLPAIAGNSGGVPDILQHNLTGLLSRSGDADDFAVKIRILMENPVIRKEMRATAKNVIPKVHAFETTADKIHTLVSSTLKRYRLKK